MQLEDVTPPGEREFTLRMSEGELAVLMVAAQEAVGPYAVGSRAKKDLAAFLNLCESVGIDPATFHLV
jgi:hypothetical protein